MACCNEQLANLQEIDMTDLPDKTFCCMGRVAFMMCNNAEHVLLGKPKQSWFDLREEDQLRYGAMAKSVMTRTFRADSNFEILFEATLRTMATAA